MVFSQKSAISDPAGLSYELETDAEDEVIEQTHIQENDSEIIIYTLTQDRTQIEKTPSAVIYQKEINLQNRKTNH